MRAASSRVLVPLTIATVICLASGCSREAQPTQVASATYRVPASLDDVARGSAILVEGEILSEPRIKAIVMTRPEKGERATQSLWSYELTDVRVTRIVLARGSTQKLPTEGSTIQVGVAILNPSIGNSLQPLDHEVLVDYPAAGESLSSRLGESGLFMISDQRDLGDGDTRGYEVNAYLAGGRLLAIPGPLRGTSASEEQFVESGRRTFSSTS